MRNLSLLLIFLLTTSMNSYAQEKSEALINISESIYFSSFEKKFSPIQFAFHNAKQLDSHRFIRFDEARLEENLSNSMSFNDIGRKPSKYYLDTYKKIYELKGQKAAFFKMERLYEVPPQYQNSKRNK